MTTPASFLDLHKAQKRVAFGLSVIAMTLTGCGAYNEMVSKTVRYHDSEAQVTCWIAYAPESTSISCLPDAQVATGGRSSE